MFGKREVTECCVDESVYIVLLCDLNFLAISLPEKNSSQSPLEDTVWLTTAQTGFPTTATEGELDNILDRQLGKPTARCLHPAISAYILQRQQELLS